MLDEIKPESVSFYDVCRKADITDDLVVQFAAEGCKTNEFYCIPDIPKKCEATQRPLDFVYDRKTDTYDLSQFETDMDLIAKIQSGKGDETFMFYGHKNLYVELMFAGTIPKEIT